MKFWLEPGSVPRDVLWLGECSQWLSIHQATRACEPAAARPEYQEFLLSHLCRPPNLTSDRQCPCYYLKMIQFGWGWA